MPPDEIRRFDGSAIFGTCTVVSVNGTPVEAEMCTFTLESTHFIFNKCPIYTHDGASAKFSTSWDETDYSALFGCSKIDRKILEIYKYLAVYDKTVIH